jgi:type I restriction enzyme S subunit
MFKNFKDERWKIPKEWEWVDMIDVTDITGGGTPKADEIFFQDSGGIPWITPDDLTFYPEIYISRGERNLSNIGLKSSGAQIIPKDSVILTSRAPIGIVAIAKNDLTTNQGIKSFTVKDKKKLLPEYLFFYLSCSSGYLHYKASGTTYLDLSKNRAEMLAVPLAPLNAQEKIVVQLKEIRKKLKLSLKKLNDLQGTIEFVANYEKNHKSNSEIDRLYGIYFKSIALNYFKENKDEQ